MATVSVIFFQDASLSGTGAAELAGSSADSSTDIDRGDTIAFNGSTTVLQFDDSVFLEDAASNPLVAPGTVNDIAVDSGTDVEYNYNLLAEDPVTGLYWRIDVFAFDDDGNKAYLVRGAFDPIANEEIRVGPYSGQELTILDENDVGDPNDNPALFDFLRGEGNVELDPHNNDAEGADITEFVCFTAGTMIATNAGWVDVETLRPGDLVQTGDHGFQKVAWVGARSVSKAEIESSPNLAPVRIREGALGWGLPKRDLYVSQQHRMLVSNRIVRRMFGEDEVLVAAKQLVSLEGIHIDYESNGVTYVHFMCQRHEIVFAEGAASETLYTGSEAIKILPPASREEIYAIFPELARGVVEGLPVPSARVLARGRPSRNLADRVRKNRRWLIEASPHH